MSFHGNDVTKFEIDINRNVASRPFKQKKKAAKVFKTMLYTFIVFGAIVALLVFGIFCFNKFLAQPRFVIKRVCVLNNRTISPMTIVRIAKIRTNMNIYATSLIPITKRLENHPDIKIAKISKKHPDMLVIKVIEREPTAVIVSDNSHYDIPVDSDGIMLSDKKMEYALHLPKITGLRNVFYRPGKMVSDPRVAIALKYLDMLKRVKKNTFINVKKIVLERPNEIVFKSATVDKIYLKSDFSPDVILKLVRVFDELRFQRLNAKKIDLRFKNVAITPMQL